MNILHLGNPSKSLRIGFLLTIFLGGLLIVTTINPGLALAADQSTVAIPTQATGTTSSTTDPSANSSSQTVVTASSASAAPSSSSSDDHEASSSSEASSTSVADSQSESVSSSTNQQETVDNVDEQSSSDDSATTTPATSTDSAAPQTSNLTAAKTTSETEVAKPTVAAATPQPAATTTETQSTDTDQLTVPDVSTSTNPQLKQSSSNPFINFLTNVTSYLAAGVVYPLVVSRQGSQITSKFRTLMNPTRYDISKTWEDLDNKYDPAYSKTYYTEAKNWYDNEAVKQTITVPFSDGTGTASATYISHPGSTKTIIYGQGWTTEPEWMGYVSKIFYDMGYNVLMPYTRGQSSSDGEWITFGYKDKDDWLNWINAVNKINGTNGEIVLYGQSLGADSALETAAEDNLPSNVKAVIADCGYSTLPSLLYSIYSGTANSLNNVTSKIGWNLNGSIPMVPFDQFLNAMNSINKLFQGFTLDDASAITAVKKSKVPTLFIATEDDTFIPDSETKTLYNLSNASLKRLWILDGNVGGHASANNAVQDYQKHIEDFMNQVDQSSTSTNSSNNLQISADQRVAA